MELIILTVIAAGIVYAGYKVLKQEKPELVEEVKAELIAVEKQAEAKLAKVEEEVKEVAKKTTARAKKALDVNQDGKVDAKDAVAAVKKARKPRAPKA